MMMIFGDSHAECFKNQNCELMNITTHVFTSSSALGLSNPNARKQTGNKILEILKTVPKTTKIMFYYGKVDVDFVLNNKLNADPNLSVEDMWALIPSQVERYINFVRPLSREWHVCVMGLFVTHLTDENMFGNLGYATRIMPREATYEKYTACLKAECAKYGIQYCDAPVIDMSKYMPKEPFDHHLHKDVYIEWIPTLCGVLHSRHHVNSTM